MKQSLHCSLYICLYTYIGREAEWLESLRGHIKSWLIYEVTF